MFVAVGSKLGDDDWGRRTVEPIGEFPRLGPRLGRAGTALPR